MKDIFSQREKCEEAKFKLDAEARFKAQARRDKLVGLWAAKKMGLSGDAADTYARAVIDTDVEYPGDAHVLRKVLADLSARGLAVDEADLRAEMARDLAIAEEQLTGEYPEALAADHERVGD